MLTDADSQPMKAALAGIALTAGLLLGACGGGGSITQAAPAPGPDELAMVDDEAAPTTTVAFAARCESDETVLFGASNAFGDISVCEERGQVWLRISARQAGTGTEDVPAATITQVIPGCEVTPGLYLGYGPAFDLRVEYRGANSMQTLVQTAWDSGREQRATMADAGAPVAASADAFGCR